jgi:hypothetical protein
MPIQMPFHRYTFNAAREAWLHANKAQILAALGGDMQSTFEPDWRPLEIMSRRGLASVGDFMFMATYHFEGKPSVHTYKHKKTRRYLNLDENCNAYRYVGEENRYEPMPLPEALEHAFS